MEQNLAARKKLQPIMTTFATLASLDNPQCTEIVHS